MPGLRGSRFLFSFFLFANLTFSLWHHHFNRFVQSADSNGKSIIGDAIIVVSFLTGGTYSKYSKELGLVLGSQGISNRVVLARAVFDFKVEIGQGHDPAGLAA